MNKRLFFKSLITFSFAFGAFSFAIAVSNNKVLEVNASSLTNNGYDAGEYQYYTGNYYDSIGDEAIAAKGTTLLSALNSLIQPSSAFGYGNIWTFNEAHDCYPSDYNGIDPLTGNAYPTTNNNAKRGKMWDMYSDKTWSSPGDRAGNYSTIGDVYNREHSMPKSWFGGSDSNQPGTDPNHLFNTDGKVNGVRSNYAYGEVQTIAKNGNMYTFNSDCVGFGKLGTNSNGTTVFEPDDAYKGDFARAQMYMATAYYNWNLTQGSGEASGCFTYSGGVSTMKAYYINLLTKWSAEDPVSQKEIDRNNAVYASSQMNRNPFIDHPGWANKIWGGTEYTWNKDDDTPKVNSVTVSPSAATLTIGGTTTQQLTATVSVSNGAAQTVNWTSSNTSVATVSSSGLVTAKAAGSTTITATSTFDNTKSGTCAITVNDSTQPSITLSKSEAALTVGGTTTITATAQNGSGSITWSSSNSSVASISGSGNTVTISGVAAGDATITATYSGKSATCSITVTAVSPTYTWNLVTSASSLSSGDVLVIGNSSQGKTAGDISSQVMDSVSSTFGTNTITSLGEGSVQLTLGGSSGAWTLSDSGGQKLGATAVKKLAWDSGTTTWSISISNNNATIQNGTSGYGSFLYNVSSPRFTTYTSSASDSMLLPQLYRRTSSTPVTPTLSSITVKTAPTKTTYTAGETFDPTGLVITRTYSDNSSSDYEYAGHSSEFSFNPNTALTTSNTSVTITYGGKSTTQIITVNQAPATSITATCSKTFYVGETITKSDITVKDNNNNDITDFSFSNYQFVYADATSGGALTNKTFTNGVTYNTLSCSLTVQVQRKARVDTSTQDNSITYTDLPTSYQTSTSERTATSGVKFIAYNLANYSSKMQFKASGGYFQTTEAMNLQSLTINNRETNALTVYGSTNGTSFSQSITGTNDVYDLTGYNYVKVMKNGSGAAYCSSLTITIGSADTATNLANYIMYEDTNNQCTSKFNTAKGYFEGLTSSERSTFMTSNDYVIATARDRLEAWARNRGQSISYSNNDYAISSAKTGLTIINNNSLLSIGLVLMVGGSLVCAGIFMLKKKEN